MPDTRVQSNGYLNVWIIPANGIANPASPTPAEINAGLNVSPAVAWDGTEFPTMTDSSDVDDRSILDAGNATTRGYAQYSGSLQFFYPRDTADTTSDFGKVFQMLRLRGGTYWVVTRILQNAKGKADPAVAGQFVSVYKFIADTFINDLDGEDSYKYTVELLPQGAAYPNAIVKLASGTVTVAGGATATLTVGARKALRATVGTHRATQLVRWTSSDPSKVSVSQNGVITGVAAGTATITATHPAAGDSTGVTVTVSA